MLAAMMSLIAAISDPPLAIRKDQLDGLPRELRAEARARFRRAGVIVLEEQLDPKTHRPTGLCIDEHSSVCGVPTVDPHPFSGRERDASQCSGYFIEGSLFLTAAHCLCNALPRLAETSIGRGYYTPDSPMKTVPIGLIAHPVAQQGVQRDWIIVDTRARSCTPDRKDFQRRVEAWARRMDHTTAPTPGDDAYLISSPLGFSLHLTRGHVVNVYGRHSIPAWYESSGGPIFDASTGQLLGVQSRINHGGRFSCHCPEPKPPAKKPPCSACQAVLPTPATLPKGMTGTYVPTTRIVDDIDAGRYTITLPSSPSFAALCVDITSQIYEPFAGACSCDCEP